MLIIPSEHGATLLVDAHLSHGLHLLAIHAHYKLDRKPIVL